MIASAFAKSFQTSGIVASLFGSGGEPPSTGLGSRQDILTRIRSKKCRILIVDDTDLFRKSVMLRLETRYGAAVRYTRAGSDAIEIVKTSTQRFDLILLDILLIDEVDGLAVYKTMREGGIDTPVLFMSAAYSESARKTIASWGETILQKPSLDYARIEAVLLSCRGDDAS